MGNRPSTASIHRRTCPLENVNRVHSPTTAYAVQDGEDGRVDTERRRLRAHGSSECGKGMIAMMMKLTLSDLNTQRVSIKAGERYLNSFTSDQSEVKIITVLYSESPLYQRDWKRDPRTKLVGELQVFCPVLVVCTPPLQSLPKEPWCELLNPGVLR